MRNGKCVCYGIIILYVVNMYYSHQLIIKAVSLMAKHNKFRLNNQTEDSLKEGRNSKGEIWTSH